MNVSRYANPEGYKVDHLNVADAKWIIERVQPKVAILTHFAISMLRAKPWKVATTLEKETDVKVIAAWDGMTYELPAH